MSENPYKPGYGISLNDNESPMPDNHQIIGTPENLSSIPVRPEYKSPINLETEALVMETYAHNITDFDTQIAIARNINPELAERYLIDKNAFVNDTLKKKGKEFKDMFEKIIRSIHEAQLLQLNREGSLDQIIINQARKIEDFALNSPLGDKTVKAISNLIPNSKIEYLKYQIKNSHQEQEIRIVKISERSGEVLLLTDISNEGGMLSIFKMTTEAYNKYTLEPHIELRQ